MSRSLIVGRALGVVWPLGRWGAELGREGVEKEGGGEVVFGGTRVVKGREEVPEEWEGLVRAGF
jgi:hypothetical protein